MKKALLLTWWEDMDEVQSDCFVNIKTGEIFYDKDFINNCYDDYGKLLEATVIIDGVSYDVICWKIVK